MNALLKYPGAKWRIADWVIGFFPEHHSYLEPFFGSGAVFFRKPRSNIETINDLDGDVVNLFECVRLDPEKLAHMVRWTPYSRQVFEQGRESAPPVDRFERAVAFLVRCNMSFGYRTNDEVEGWRNDVQGRERAYSARCWTDLPEQIIAAAERLRGVQIECRPATELIQRFNFPNVLIYADPPYMLETRNREQYRCEMSDQDHRDLLDVLLAHRGPVLLSGYDSELYQDALRGWHVEWKTSRTHALVQKDECLWMNFEPEHQLDLLGEL